jgi:hypothetical protein
MVMSEQTAVFDTNILIDYLNAVPEAKVALDTWGNKPAISIVTWMEVMVGAKRFGQEPQTRHFLNGFDVLPVNQAVAEQAVEIRKQYGMKLPDVIILASTHVSMRLLITRNTKDFQHVPGIIFPYTLE